MTQAFSVIFARRGSEALPPRELETQAASAEPAPESAAAVVLADVGFLPSHADPLALADGLRRTRGVAGHAGGGAADRRGPELGRGRRRAVRPAGRRAAARAS